MGCDAGTIVKVHNSQLAAMQMENITFFLEGCVALGVPRVSDTQPRDRRHLGCILSLVSGLHSLSLSLSLALSLHLGCILHLPRPSAT